MKQRVGLSTFTRVLFEDIMSVQGCSHQFQFQPEHCFLQTLLLMAPPADCFAATCAVVKLQGRSENGCEWCESVPSWSSWQAPSSQAFQFPSKRLGKPNSDNVHYAFTWKGYGQHKAGPLVNVQALSEAFIVASKHHSPPPLPHSALFNLTTLNLNPCCDGPSIGWVNDTQRHIQKYAGNLRLHSCTKTVLFTADLAQ